MPLKFVIVIFFVFFSKFFPWVTITNLMRPRKKDWLKRAKNDHDYWDTLYIIVLILDVNSEMGAHVRSKIGKLPRLKPFFQNKSSRNLNVMSEKSIFLHKCATCSELPSYIRTMLYTVLDTTYIHTNMQYICTYERLSRLSVYIWKQLVRTNHITINSPPPLISP